MLPMRVILDVRTHLKVCPFESEGMEKYFIQMKMTRKLGQQHSYYTEQSSKQTITKDKKEQGKR